MSPTKGIWTWRKVRCAERPSSSRAPAASKALPNSLADIPQPAAGHAVAALARAGRGQFHRARQRPLPDGRARRSRCRQATCACSGAACRIRWTMRSDDVIYAGAHLPLVHFFRLHLPSDVPQPPDDGRDAGDLGDRRVGPPQFRALEPLLRAPAIAAKTAARGQRTAAPAGAGAVRALPAGAGGFAERGRRQSVRPAVVAQCRAHVRFHRREFPATRSIAWTSPRRPTSIPNMR